MYDASEAFLAMLETLEMSFVMKSFSLDHPVSFEGCDVDAWKQHIEKTNSSTFLCDILLGQSEQKYNDSITYEHFTGLTLSNCDSVDKGITNYLHDGDITRRFTRLPMILPIIFQKSTMKEFIHYDVSLTISDVHYKLFAVLIHDGNEHGGHWYMFGSHHDKWFLFNDENVSQIHNIDQIIQKNAILILYKRDVK